MRKTWADFNPLQLYCGGAAQRPGLASYNVTRPRSGSLCKYGIPQNNARRCPLLRAADSGDRERTSQDKVVEILHKAANLAEGKKVNGLVQNVLAEVVASYVTIVKVRTLPSGGIKRPKFQAMDSSITSSLGL